MITAAGTFKYGYTDKDGVTHREFELRAPTMADVESAIAGAEEEAGGAAATARIKRHMWALTMTRLGTLPPDRITPEILGGLASTEYGILDAVGAELEKKREAASGETCASAV